MDYEIEITINKRAIKMKINTILNTGSVGSIRCFFVFDSEWYGLTKTAIFKGNNGVYPVLIREDVCTVPNEVLSSGTYLNLGVMGTKDGDLVIPTGWIGTSLLPGCYESIAPPTEDIYLQILGDFNARTAEVKSAAETAQKSAEEIKGSLPAIHEDAETAKEKASEAANAAKEAAAAAAGAKTSETNAKQSETASSQNLADLLRMLGSDIATLVGGKIPMSQIPATATQEIYEVQNESELVGLIAQRGDLAELVELVDGEKTITKTWQLIGDGNPAVPDNWVVWGTSYAVQAGNATTADNAVNASMINDHRLVEMTDEEFASAVKDPETYYIVG